MTIKINLNNLTQAMLEAALPNMGKCTYTAPCIIGALVDEKSRAVLQAGPAPIAGLVLRRVAEIPKGQLNDATELQAAFGGGNEPELRRIAAKYIKEPA